MRAAPGTFAFKRLSPTGLKALALPCASAAGPQLIPRMPSELDTKNAAAAVVGRHAGRTAQ